LPTKFNITTIADLLNYFDGDSEVFETWKKQVKFLRATYRFDDDVTKLLIGMRLKGRAMEWFHSKLEYIRMKSDELLDGLRSMFYHRPNKIALRHRFEERMWKKNETFRDYVHEKTIMANRIAIEDDEILGYIIDGIPDPNLRDLARVQGFTTKDDILQAFSEISLRDRSCTAATTNSKSDDGGNGARRRKDRHFRDTSMRNEDKKASEKKERSAARHCFNCGAKDHVSQTCPTKSQGQKCFECNKYGHIARYCPTKTEAATINRCAGDRSEQRKKCKRKMY
jgi:hypothetical protein